MHHPDDVGVLDGVRGAMQATVTCSGPQRGESRGACVGTALGVREGAADGGTTITNVCTRESKKRQGVRVVAELTLDVSVLRVHSCCDASAFVQVAQLRLLW